MAAAAQSLLPPAAPLVVLVVCKRLDAGDLTGSAGSALRRMVRASSAALMNTATPVRRSWRRVLFTVAAGNEVTMPDGFHGFYQPSELYPGHQATAGEIYCRRTGYTNLPPKNVLVCPQIALLESRHLLNQLPNTLIEASHSALSSRFVSVTRDRTFSRQAAILATNERGIVSGSLFPLRTSSALVAASNILMSPQGLTVVSAASPGSHDGITGAALAAALVQQSKALHLQSTIILLGLTATPTMPLPAQWRRLVLLVISGDSVPPGEIYSPTTRTYGLVSDTDIEPTILGFLGTHVPPFTTGRKLQFVSNRSGSGTIKQITYNDKLALLNGAGTVRIMLPLAMIAIVIVVASMLAQSQWKRAWRLTNWILLSALSLPMALLIAPLFHAGNLTSYGFQIAGIMVSAGFIASVIADKTNRPGTTVVTGVFLAMLAIDLITGGRLIRNAMLGGYALSGIRYYGIGNEYLGVVLGMVTLPLGGLALSTGRCSIAKLVVFYIFIIAIFGWPGWGANAGSVVVDTVAAASLLLPATGRKFGIGAFLASICAGFALAFAFAAADAWLGGPDVSHAGMALTTAAGSRGLAYLGQIIIRKIQMNLHLSVSHWLLIAASITIAFSAAMFLTFKQQIAEAAFIHQDLALGWKALLWTMSAALITKDSGIVTVVFALGSATVSTTWYALCWQPIRSVAPRPSLPLAPPSPDAESS